MEELRGTLWALLLYDVSEEIRLDVARESLGAAPPERGPEFRRPAPEYVRFAHPPLVYSSGSVRLQSGEVWAFVIKPL